MSGSDLVTYANLILNVMLFARLFTFRRYGRAFRLHISLAAMVLMYGTGSTIIYVLTGRLHNQADCWPMLIVFAVFTWAVYRAQGNLGGLFKADCKRCVYHP